MPENTFQPGAGTTVSYVLPGPGRPLVTFPLPGPGPVAPVVVYGNRRVDGRGRHR